MDRAGPARVVWTVLNEGSFASVRVRLPPGAGVHCESDAVITMSDGIDVRGVVSGGLLAGLARTFLTHESFFTTRVENQSRGVAGDALLAPSDPGGVVLHRLDHGDEMLLTSGAYLAGDDGVKIMSEMQTRIGNSLLSGTGFFLLRAQGQGTVAIASYGSVHKYVLTSGERRMVDNGHLVAWTASMNYRVGLASRRGGMLNSVTSGEGLMCEFEGPGIIYLQSHKIDLDGSSKAKSQRNAGSPFAILMFFLFVIMFIAMAFFAVYFSMQQEGNFSFADDAGYRRKQQRQHHHGYNDRVGGANDQYQGGRRAGEF